MKATTAKAVTVVPKRKFTLREPNAKSVCLAGDFTQWQAHAIPLRKNRSGLWQTSVSLQPGTYHYRFLVDGQWRDDPQCALHQPNPFGSADAVCVVS